MQFDQQPLAQLVTESLLPYIVHCVQKNTHSHFLSYLHELFVDLKTKIAVNIPI